MPLDIFLKVDGIEGDATAQGHVNEINVVSFSWGVANPVAGLPAEPRVPAGKPTVQNVSVIKAIDKASPKLFLACVSGGPIKQCVLTVHRASGSPQTFSVSLTDCLIVAMSDAVTHGSEAGQETVVISFAKIQFGYTLAKADGSAGTPVEVGWNVLTNTSA